MKLWLISGLCLWASLCFGQHPGALPLTNAKFSTGDNPAWKDPGLDDRAWKDIKTGNVWQAQGWPDYHGFAWYRIHIVIPASLKTDGRWKDSLRIYLAHVNDVDETWLNGVKIGKIGGFPEDPGGYVSKWPAVREYHVAIDNAAIHWDQDNVIAIRDYDGGGTGGIFMGEPYLDMLERTDGLNLTGTVERITYNPGADSRIPIELVNRFNTTVKGTLSYDIEDLAAGKTLTRHQEPLTLAAFGKKQLAIAAPGRAGIRCSYRFEEAGTGLQVKGTVDLPYILTPPATEKPHINSASVFGVHPGSPFLFKIAATGRKPLTYDAKALPAGLTLDAATGLITGVLPAQANYSVRIRVSNSAGVDTQTLTLAVGDRLALTPPMGWNSWNCWGLSVSDEKVRSSAQALLDKGLADHGWTYINIDDGWQAASRAADSNIVPNEKFPAMQALGDWLHRKGLKFGIYSSPGPRTCGGFLGSWMNEAKDADIYGAWGIDYLKYDWCSYDGIVKDDTTLASYIRPYSLMQQALARQKRDMIYSLCQYGMKDVWKWGPSVDGQSWRTTEDIEDTWESMKNIGFRQDQLYPYAKPGSWNDPDMMIVGQVGWGENLHASRLTPDEQYTHVSLWCMLSAPLLIGCDLSRLDPFTLNLLTNDEILAIDQDPLGRQASRVLGDDAHQVWIKDLTGGRKAVAIFNMDSVYRKTSLDFASVHLPESLQLRDPWRQKDLGRHVKSFEAMLPPHGVQVLIVKY